MDKETASEKIEREVVRIAEECAGDKGLKNPEWLGSCTFKYSQRILEEYAKSEVLAALDKVDEANKYPEKINGMTFSHPGSPVSDDVFEVTKAIRKSLG